MKLGFMKRCEHLCGYVTSSSDMSLTCVVPTVFQDMAPGLKSLDIVDMDPGLKSLDLVDVESCLQMMTVIL